MQRPGETTESTCEAHQQESLCKITDHESGYVQVKTYATNVRSHSLAKRSQHIKQRILFVLQEIQAKNI